MLSIVPMGEKKYLEWVNEEEKLEKIRYSIKRGRPYGDDSWAKKIAKK